MSPPSVRDLLADLDAERAQVIGMVREIRRPDWTTPTRAVGWTVRDQIAHLGWFDAAFARAISTPDAFTAERDAITDLQSYVDRANDGAPAVGPAALAWWQDAARAFDRAALDLDGRDAKARLPWYGPAMSLRSAVTSRIMETWAHGDDVADALGVHLEPTDRLRHVADLAVRARAQGYRARGLEPPTSRVLVELTAPSGETWTYGESDSQSLQEIRGDADEFCRVLVRRRHIDDTGLEVTGGAARDWMLVGQAFAGGPGADPARVGVAR